VFDSIPVLYFKLHHLIFRPLVLVSVLVLVFVWYSFFVCGMVLVSVLDLE
jgi:hypothetical protein